MKLFLHLLLMPVFFISFKSYTQTDENVKLFNEIKHIDSLLFKSLSNCDTVSYKKYFATDLEFYHDKGGVSSYQNEIASVVNNCKLGIKVRRELVPNTLKVFPIKEYGAIEEGSHTFYFTEPGKKEERAGTFKFIHVWRFENQSWKISRVISYDH